MRLLTTGRELIFCCFFKAKTLKEKRGGERGKREGEGGRGKEAPGVAEVSLFGRVTTGMINRRFRLSKKHGNAYFLY